MAIERNKTGLRAIAGLFAVASLLVLVAQPARAELTPPAFYQLAPSNEEAMQYEQGRQLAIELLGSVVGLDESAASLAAEVGKQLASARFVVAAGAEADRQCAQVAASLFVLQTVPGTIHVCADTRWHVQNEPGPVNAILAQGFIHEGVHLAGITDECEATRLELLVARATSGITSFANLQKYGKQCGGLLESARLRRK